ncbi:uncharacterized protein LOC121754397 [Salvia splendens]|uniref:uncharacterized protein LOC121754397 n=1 Tax=Salvia splendens TaxID=180675 RepID=UPI001C278C61|nr:uncharacterized protein LOC121754397 [Salvia splendens]
MDDDEYQRALDEAFDAVVEEVEREERAAAAAVPRPIHHRQTVRRDHVGANQLLLDDYFAGNPRFLPELFCRHFRMSQRLFLHISTSLARRYMCFTLRRDASGRIELSMLQKCTAAIRQDAYARLAEAVLDDGQHRLHTLGMEELSGGLEMTVHNWVQKQTLVDDPRSRSNNNINVLQSSPLFNEQCPSEGPKISFVASGTQYKRAYYLADEIYPLRWDERLYKGDTIKENQPCDSS